MRWNKLFDGSPESLADKSHRPLTPHPNTHSETELKWIRDLHRRNPHISLLEMYGKLKTSKGYKRHPLSLYRVFVRLGFSSKAPSTQKAYVPKPYHIPDKNRHKMANGCEVCSFCLSHGTDSAKVLPVHSH